MPYGGLETWPKPLGPETDLVLPVSVKESPKAYIFLKGGGFVLEMAVAVEDDRIKMVVMEMRVICEEKDVVKEEAIFDVFFGYFMMCLFILCFIASLLCL